MTPEDIQLSLFGEGWRLASEINQLFSVPCKDAFALLKLKLA